VTFLDLERKRNLNKQINVFSSSSFLYFFLLLFLLIVLGIEQREKMGEKK
jgi:hypothetical protein